MNEKPDTRAIAAAIAKALGATLLPLRTDRDADQWQRVTLAEGPELSIHYDGWKKRLVVGLTLPTYKDRDGSTQHQSPRDLEWILKRDGVAETPETRITADVTRAPEAIARDIRRRLIPGAIQWHSAALKRRDDLESHARGINDTVAYLAKALKCQPRQGTELCPGSITVRVTGPDNVGIDRLYCTAETAVKIYRLLAAEKSGE